MDKNSLMGLIVLCILLGAFLGAFLMWYIPQRIMKFRLKDGLKRIDDFMKESKQQEEELVKYYNVVNKYGLQINKYLVETINNNIGKTIDKKIIDDINLKLLEINRNKENEAQLYLSNINQRFKKLVEEVEEENESD